MNAEMPLAGACLRPLGHLSGTRLIQGKAAEAQGLSGSAGNFPQSEHRAGSCRTAREQSDILQGLAYTARTECSPEVPGLGLS